MYALLYGTGLALFTIRTVDVERQATGQGILIPERPSGTGPVVWHCHSEREQALDVHRAIRGVIVVADTVVNPAAVTWVVARRKFGGGDSW